jgi:hypothetical protein
LQETQNEPTSKRKQKSVRLNFCVFSGVLFGVVRISCVTGARRCKPGKLDRIALSSRKDDKGPNLLHHLSSLKLQNPDYKRTGQLKKVKPDAVKND